MPELVRSRPQQVSESLKRTIKLGRFTLRRTKTAMTAATVRIIDHETPNLHAGDLLFGYREFWIQGIQSINAEPWTHSAIVVDDGPSLRTIELGREGVISRSLDQFEASYSKVGILRPDFCATCIAQATDFARSIEQDPLIKFGSSQCVAIACVGLARRVMPKALVARFERAMFVRLAPQSGGPTLTCSSFVSLCASAATCCGYESVWPTRGSVPAWRSGPSATDLHRTTPRTYDGVPGHPLITPSDIWVDTPARFRWVEEPSGRTTLIFDSWPNLKGGVEDMIPAIPIPVN